MIAATASSAQVYDQDYKFLFGTFTPNETLTEPIAEIVTEQNKDIKRVAILARNDLFPLAIAQEIEKSAKAQGLEVVTFERYAIGTMDHAAAITQMRAASPDWVFATGYINDLILIRKQMNDLGLQAAGRHHDRRARPTRNSRGRRAARREHHRARPGGIRRCATRARTCSARPRPSSGLGEEIQGRGRLRGGLARPRAARSCSSRSKPPNSIDPAKVRDALAAIDTETFYGRVKFGPTGQINSLEPPVFQIQGGKPVVLWPAAIKQGEFRFSIPN